MNGTKTIRSKVSWLGAVKIWESFTLVPQCAPGIREALSRATPAPLDFYPCDDCRRGSQRLQGRGVAGRQEDNFWTDNYLPQTEIITPPATMSAPPTKTGIVAT